MKPHTLSILVENKAGVLSRVTGLFSRRGFNIESLAVGPCEEPGMSRITIVVIGDDEKIEQVMKQLNKLIDIIKVSDLTENERVERELALIKVTAEQGPPVPRSCRSPLSSGPRLSMLEQNPLSFR